MPTTPSHLLCPGGGDGCREAELVSSGDGPCGPSPGYARQRGRRMPADRPITLEPVFENSVRTKLSFSRADPNDRIPRRLRIAKRQCDETCAFS